MEFPDLGEHCSLAECRRLDFLPIKCSSCSKIFCSNHFLFEAHKCPEANLDDNQVPVCPLCNKPVPIKPGESPDYKVSEHIDQNCNSQREKVFKNRCSLASCKKKELMPLLCESCGLNHCLAHRHPSDHNCEGPKVRPNSAASSGRSSQLLNSFSRKSANAYSAIRTNVINTINSVNLPSMTTANTAARSSTGTRQVTPISSLQGNLSEEEALNIAIQESLASSNRSGSSSQTANNAQKCRVS